MMVIFLRRTAEDVPPEVFAAAEISAQGRVAPEWTGPDVKTAKSLLGGNWPRAGGKLDLSDRKTWARLPELISGSRLWVTIGQPPKQTQRSEALAAQITKLKGKPDGTNRIR